MNKYFTLMLLPERHGKVRTWRISLPVFRSMAVITSITLIVLGILSYDYKQVLDQVHENKNLALENKKLRDQLNIFQMKLTSLSQDIERIRNFERKLKVLVLPQGDLGRELDKTPLEESLKSASTQSISKKTLPSLHQHFNSLGEFLAKKTKNQNSDEGRPKEESLIPMEAGPEFEKLKTLYQQKVAEDLYLNGENNALLFSDIPQKAYRLGEEFARFDFNYENLKDSVLKIEEGIHQIDTTLLERESFLSSTPSILPTDGWITSYYGLRKSPYSGRIKMHEGLDIGARSGTDIVASADGIVTYSAGRAGFGKFVQINHGYGVETVYGHAKTLVARKGQYVRRGDVIAKVGSTGYSTGPHLHYEVRVNGTPVDPLYFILND